MYDKVVKICLESLELSKKVKPSQYAKRLVLEKYKLLGSPIDRWSTKILYSVFKHLGVIDKIINLCFEGESFPEFVQNCFRIVVNDIIYLKKSEKLVFKTIRKILVKHKYEQYKMELQKLIKYLSKFEFPKTDNLEEYLFWYESFPVYLTRKLKKLLPEDQILPFVKSINKRAPISLRVNTLLTSPEELKKIFETKYRIKTEYGIFLKTILKTTAPVPFERMKEFREGYFTVQDEAAALVPHILDPASGEIVLDLCAAPGGKTTLIAELMKNKGRIYAIDISKKRINRLVWNCKRMKITIVFPYQMDGKKANLFFYKSVDKILMDVPCTSSGTLRKNPEVRWFLNDNEIEEYSKLQKQLFESGLKCLKDDGIGVYSTCSIFKEENEEIIKYFLDKGEIEILNINFPLSNAISEEEKIRENCKRTWTHLHDCDSFFIAKFRKLP